MMLTTSLPYNQSEFILTDTGAIEIEGALMLE
jgi:hypothetical protein